MDLYGSGVSIGQANAQTQQAREASIAATDFNNGLAEELDRANAEQDDDRKAAAQKNIVSGTASASKFIARDGLRNLAADKLGLSRVGKFVKTTLAERMAKEAGAERVGAVGDISTPEDLRRAVSELGEGGEIGAERFARGVNPQTLQRLATRFSGRPLATSAGDVAGIATEAAEPVGLFTAEVADETGGTAAAVDESVERIGTSATAREGEKVALETAEKATGDIAKFAGKVGRVGIAGLGGGIDVAADVGRFMEGKRGLDMFGSNSAQRVGNIGNIVGSGLELAGLATAGIPPLGLTLEAAGAITGLVSSVVEGVGDEESAAESKEKEEQDITSQRRSQTVAQNVSQVTGRTM